MLFEKFESRSVMAGDAFHNFVYPEDTDSNGAVTPLDALVVINRLNQSSLDNAAGASAAIGSRFNDVNADASVTPIDALVVINLLNSQSSAGVVGQRASQVEVDRRIERIERAIASNNLPPGLNADQARTILETLRSGGRPELGDFVQDGALRWSGDRVNEVTKLPVNTEGGPVAVSDGDDLGRQEWLIGAIAERLRAFGVSSTVINAIATEMRDAHQAGQPLDMLQIRDRLGELGVDVAKILPQPSVPSQPPPAFPPSQPDQPDRPGRPLPPADSDQPVMPTIMVTPPIADSIVARMQAAGIAEQVIATIRGEIWGAIGVDRPLDLQQVRARLAELGVPWERLETPPVTTLPVPPSPPTRPGQPGIPRPPEGPDQPVMPTIMVAPPIADSIVARMQAAGIAEQVIATIRGEIWGAIGVDRPLDLQQVRARLAELGVPWERLETPPVTALPVPPSPPIRPDQPDRPGVPELPEVPE
jgi:hypothetical protein